MFPELTELLVRLWFWVIGKKTQNLTEEDVSRTIIWCDGKGHRSATLDCGCVEMWALDTFDDAQHLERCECGKFHQVRSQEREYRDCPTHAPFFQRWPTVHRFYLGGKCPQISGIGAEEAFDLLRAKGVNLDDSQKWELIGAFNKNALFRGVEAHSLVTSEFGLVPEMRDVIAGQVQDPFYAKLILRDSLALSTQVRRKLAWVIWKRLMLLWLLRVLLLGISLAGWVWHIPDWRTVVVLGAAALALWGFSSEVRKIVTKQPY